MRASRRFLLALCAGLAALAGPAAALEPAAELWPGPSHDFAGVIVPLLTRLGCNGSSCHGAALGQAGFKLSLFGNDPRADWLAITHDLSGRRIDRADPARSLFLRKPSRDLPHKGGRVAPEGSDPYRTLLAWAESGFPPPGDGPQVAALEAEVAESLAVRARYSDGTLRDVTRLAIFTTNDDAIALVDREGKIDRRGPGETSIMVRFAGHVAAVRVGRPFPRDAGSAAPARLERRGAIDEHVGRTLERLALEPSAESSDAVFLRRASLDLIGTLPSAEEARGFLARPDRDGLVKSLLARPELDLYWGYRLDQLFGVSARRMGAAEAAAFHRWLAGRARRPWAETARAVLVASGFEPAAAFWRQTSDPKEMAEQVGRVFLGTRWGCAQCHDHPFERFRRDDYFGMAALLTRVRVTDAGVADLDRGEITHPRTGKPAIAAFPEGKPAARDADRRRELAEWVVSRPQFKRAFANRVWALLMGRGLVEPADDFRASNPPSDPDLLDELSRHETLPDLLQAIAGSAAYRRAGATARNRDDSRACSHSRPRPLSAEVLADAMTRATGVEELWAGRPAGTRAIDLGDSSLTSYTLDVCGRNRPSFEGSLARELHFLAGDALGTWRLAGAAALLPLEDRPLLEELYLRTLSRRPTPEEERVFGEELSRGPRREVVEDLLWAILDSWEFMTCH